MQKNIFDKMMGLPILNIFEPFYIKHKEPLLYLFFGGLTFTLSVAIYTIANVMFGINELIANVISWIIAVMFAFLTNRTWVFGGGTECEKPFTSQMIYFFSGRIITLVIEEVILLIFITWMGLPSVAVKVFAQIVVIVLNYVISKLWVFRNA